MIYGCSTYKSILDDSPRRLSDYEELRHILAGVQRSDGQCIAKFPNGDFIFPGELEEQLRSLVGKKIACLRLDGKIHIRDLDAEAGNAAR
jgi:hypothetical protein